MSTAKRDPNQSKSGKAPTFQIRITPELKAQFEAAAKEAGMSLGNWLKNLGREELKKNNNKNYLNETK
ncbi:toxin-antitoxin system HicB family antitoxin [Enterobacter cloacae]|jgi:predicted HicB family RNase H-like nuclease|uniref:toxin-antitoxin system HicB family antitoxin n=1 Tax=Enterobacter quasihormaechei TaxID=2529382 RepID=UPI0028829A28|nr:toxin-antitoxin system HicB family antitoxin [Enterobacter cloacae]